MPTRIRTQADADREIDRRIRTALRWERRRDRQPFESPAYWRFHDLAIRAHHRAARLMPRGSQSE